MSQDKVRSTASYFHDFPNGESISTSVSKNGKPISSMELRKMPLDVEVDVLVAKYGVDSVVDTPIGLIPSVSIREKKEFDMTVKQYRDFVIRFWENGPDYWDMI